MVPYRRASARPTPAAVRNAPVRRLRQAELIADVARVANIE